MLARVFMFAALCSIGCGGGGGAAPAPRGVAHESGKADEAGSCLGGCGGIANNGACWCDDECASFGDCCADKASICDANPCELSRGVCRVPALTDDGVCGTGFVRGFRPLPHECGITHPDAICCRKL